MKLHKILPELWAHGDKQAVANLQYYQQLLNQSSVNAKTRALVQGIINNIKAKNNLASPKQLLILQKLKMGNLFEIKPKANAFGDSNSRLNTLVTDADFVEEFKGSMEKDWYYRQDETFYEVYKLWTDLRDPNRLTPEQVIKLIDYFKKQNPEWAKKFKKDDDGEDRSYEREYEPDDDLIEIKPKADKKPTVEELYNQLLNDFPSTEIDVSGKQDGLYIDFIDDDHGRFKILISQRDFNYVVEKTFWINDEEEDSVEVFRTPHYHDLINWLKSQNVALYEIKPRSDGDNMGNLLERLKNEIIIRQKFTTAVDQDGTSLEVIHFSKPHSEINNVLVFNPSGKFDGKATNRRWWMSANHEIKGYNTMEEVIDAIKKLRY